MVKIFPTALHSIPGEAWQDFHQQVASHLCKLIRHSKTHLVHYQTYQIILILIQIQIRHILICQTYLIYWTPGTLNSQNVHVRNVGVKILRPTL